MYRYRRFIIKQKEKKTSEINPISKSGYTLERSDRV